MKPELRQATSIQVQFDETDLLGVVHNAVVFRYFDRGRLELMEKIIPFETFRASGLALMVVRNLCEYKHPATYPDELVLITRLRCPEPYDGRLRFLHELTMRRSRRLVAIGESDIVLVEWRTRTLLQNPPKELKEALLAPFGTDK